VRNSRGALGPNPKRAEKGEEKRKKNRPKRVLKPGEEDSDGTGRPSPWPCLSQGQERRRKGRKKKKLKEGKKEKTVKSSGKRQKTDGDALW